MMYTITNVNIKDHAICTLTPLEGKTLTVTAPKEMFKSVKHAVKNRKHVAKKGKVKKRHPSINSKAKTVKYNKVKIGKLKLDNTKLFSHHSKNKKSQASKPHIS